MKLPVLVGSQALLLHNRLEGRVPSDWDFIAEKPTGIYKGNVDISDANCINNPTNKYIYEKSQSGVTVKTPFGEAKLIPLSLLKLMKISSLPLNKFKNLKDLDQLLDVFLNEEEFAILELRKKETEVRVSAQKDSFFNKYDIERHIDHDKLHYFLNKTPVFLKTLKDSVTVSEDLFLKLTLEEKRRLIWEESFILALERFFIPNVIQFPMMVDVYCDQFYNCDKSTDPSLFHLNKLCNPNGLKDHPEFIQKWAYTNYNFIISGYKKWWEESFYNLDSEFWKILASKF